MLEPTCNFPKLTGLWSTWTVFWRIVFKWQAWRVSLGKSLWESSSCIIVLCCTQWTLTWPQNENNLSYSTHWALRLWWCYSASLSLGPPVPSEIFPLVKKGRSKFCSPFTVLEKITLTSWMMGTCGASHTFHTLLAKAIQIVALERCHNQIPHRNLPPRRSRTRCPPVWHKDYVTWTLHMH